MNIKMFLFFGLMVFSGVVFGATEPVVAGAGAGMAGAGSSARVRRSN